MKIPPISDNQSVFYALFLCPSLARLRASYFGATKNPKCRSIIKFTPEKISGGFLDRCRRGPLKEACLCQRYIQNPVVTMSVEFR